MSKLGKPGKFCWLSFFKFWVQMHKVRHFGPKSINFLISKKFCMYAISKVLNSNVTLVFENFEPKFLNLGVLGEKLLTFNLNEFLPVSCFEGADFKSDVCFWKFWNFITSLNRINYFAFWFSILDALKFLHMYFLLKTTYKLYNRNKIATA